MKYIVVVSDGICTTGKEFYSNSRNSKKHLVDTGANKCVVYTLSGKPVSAARVDETGKPVNVIISDN